LTFIKTNQISRKNNDKVRLLEIKTLGCFGSRFQECYAYFVIKLLTFYWYERIFTYWF